MRLHLSFLAAAALLPTGLYTPALGDTNSRLRRSSGSSVSGISRSLGPLQLGTIADMWLWLLVEDILLPVEP